jgi:hypothetical protein
MLARKRYAPWRSEIIQNQEHPSRIHAGGFASAQGVPNTERLWTWHGRVLPNGPHTGDNHVGIVALFPPFLCLGPVRNHLFSHPRPCRTVCPHPKASSHQCLFRCRQSTRTVVLLAPLSATSILARPTQNPRAMFSRNQSMCSTECDEALNNPGRGLAVRSTRGNCGRNTKVI